MGRETFLRLGYETSLVKTNLVTIFVMTSNDQQRVENKRIVTQCRKEWPTTWRAIKAAYLLTTPSAGEHELAELEHDCWNKLLVERGYKHTR